jgi:hypothetical protein
MAHVEVIREQPKPLPPPPVTKVILALSLDEAKALGGLLCEANVGLYTLYDAIYVQLMEAVYREGEHGWKRPALKNPK